MLQEHETQFLDIHNRQRRACGLPPSTMTPELRQRAEREYQLDYDRRLRRVERLCCSQTPPAVAMAEPRQVAGLPAQRFRKELIRVGQFVSRGDTLAKIDGQTLDHWVAEFSRMKSAGVKVPVPVGHTNDPEANRGWVTDMSHEGDSLFATIELVGEDAIALAGRTDVSIYAEPNMTDGKGNRYVWPITHVALCTDPVIPGLSGFTAVAASRGGAERIEPDLDRAMKRAAGMKQNP